MRSKADSMPLRDRPQKKRYTHIIRPNDRVFVPRLRAYVDTEAIRTRLSPTVERQTLAFGWVCFERLTGKSDRRKLVTHYERFDTANGFWRALERFTLPKATMYVYAHNLAYDAAMLSVQTMARKHGWTVDAYVPAQHLLWIHLTKGTRRVYFVDTLNYFTTSLAQLGESIGFPKTTMPGDDAPQEEWDGYCRNDVDVLRAAMHAYYALVEQEDLGGYRKTAAAQAYGAWRHRFMRHRVLVVANPAVEAFEREAYHGGRVEVFYDLPITTPITCLDVNSMYAAMMRDHLYPAALWGQGERLSLLELREMLDRELVIARVQLDTPEPAYPYNTGERIIYPVGTFETVLSTPELRYALDHGHIGRISEWTSYEPRPLFTEYVETLYRLRVNYKQAGNDAFAYLLKLLLNALYGKFGQRGYRWEPCPETPIPGITEAIGNCDPDGPDLRHMLRMGRWWHQTRDPEAFESFPAIAAHVTAYGRIYLWTLIQQAGCNNVFYSDTDSLYVNVAGASALVTELNERELGKLKKEGVSTFSHFRAPKDYTFGEREKIKGVRSKARQVADATFEQEQFESYDSVLARGCDGEILVTTLTKHLTRRNHSSVGEGVGWRQPIRLPAE